ncbi:glycoside hydrolase family 32 protein [Cohnella fermenti]|uniref:Glycoside hydrolase family 32 protein n=2 Tax=Cohnella fermenti TaxID=2565925 RepID=A0A4S4BLL1_9BACL|nr:glycoside hydrolase family 32 protein [Cohnella fermenti]
MPSPEEIDDLLNSTEDDSLNDKYRPHYHFTPPSRWMNDPNGMVFFQGEYHLFYQHHPYGSEWGPMHWGHAVSRDLVVWEHLPVALEPDGNGMIFSGSAVADSRDTSGLFGGDPGLVAIFTHADTYPASGTDAEPEAEERPRQRQSVGFSADRGRTWTMYEGNPVLAEPELTDFRDPKVIWYEPGGHWVMVIAAGDHVRFYTSPNLLAWTFASEFGRTEGSHEGVWECPDLVWLPVVDEDGEDIEDAEDVENADDGERAEEGEGAEREGSWVLIVSIGDGLPEGSKTQYFLGSFDGTAFVSSSAEQLWLDEGRDNYAGVTWSDIPQEDGRTILIGWMSNWRYANVTPTGAWRGAMTIPRVLTLRSTADGLRLCQRPVEELKALRGTGERRQEIAVPGESRHELGFGGCAYEIEAVFEPSGAAEFGFALRRSADDAQETLVGYATAEAELFIDRTRAGESGFSEAFAARHGVRLRPEPDGTIRLRALVDRCSVEVFAGGGVAALTDLIYPDPGSVGLALYAKGGEARVRELSFWPLETRQTD